MSATLLVLAAGLGTRFKGGIKQLTSVGYSGELLMEYSVYDAVQAGFDRAVFVIRKDIEQLFRDKIGNKISKYIKVEYCFQDINDLPCGFSCPDGRSKPWGTVHAVLSAKDLLTEPFLIINADDYYGKDSYRSIFDFLTSEKNSSAICMGGFVLENTLSPTGTVTRGICTANEQGFLSSVMETYKLSRSSDGKICGEKNGKSAEIDGSSIVSMNMWGCSRAVTVGLSECFRSFLERSSANGTMSTAEYALPSAFDELIRNGDISVKVLPTKDKWYGMTYMDDLPKVRAAFAEMVSAGKYPADLFEDQAFSQF